MLPEDFFDKFNRKSLDFEKFVERIMNLKNSLKNDDESKLGEPISIEKFKQDGYTFEKTTWKTEDGLITKVEMIGSPFEKMEKPIVRERIDEVPLEVQLDKAIQEERYEDAARIRDEIKNNKKTLRDLIDNQAINENDEWNF